MCVQIVLSLCSEREKKSEREITPDANIHVHRTRYRKPLTMLEMEWNRKIAKMSVKKANGNEEKHT